MWTEGVWEDETEGPGKLTTDDIGVTKLISGKISALPMTSDSSFHGGEGLPQARQPQTRTSIVVDQRSILAAILTSQRKASHVVLLMQQELQSWHGQKIIGEVETRLNILIG